VLADLDEPRGGELTDELAQALLADLQFAGEVDDAAAAGRDDVQDAGLRRGQGRQCGRRPGVPAQPAGGPVEQICHVCRRTVDVAHALP
jgi:hypothetical protein